MSTDILAGDVRVHFLDENRQKRLEWIGSATGTRTVNELYSALENLMDESLQSDDGIDAYGKYLFRLPGSNLFNVHSSHGGGHKDNTFTGTIDQCAEIQFFFNRTEAFNKDFVNW